MDTLTCHVLRRRTPVERPHGEDRVYGVPGRWSIPSPTREGFGKGLYHHRKKTVHSGAVLCIVFYFNRFFTQYKPQKRQKACLFKTYFLYLHSVNRSYEGTFAFPSLIIQKVGKHPLSGWVHAYERGHMVKNCQLDLTVRLISDLKNKSSRIGLL